MIVILLTILIFAIIYNKEMQELVKNGDLNGVKKFIEKGTKNGYLFLTKI